MSSWLLYDFFVALFLFLVFIAYVPSYLCMPAAKCPLKLMYEVV